MSDDESVDLKEVRSESEIRDFHETVLEDLDDAERELDALLDEPEANQDEVREEVHSLFNLTKRFVRRSEELEVEVATHVKALEETKDRTETAQERIDDAMERLGLGDENTS